MYVNVEKWVSIGLYLCCVLLGWVRCIDIKENIEDVVVPALSDHVCEDYHPRCAEYKAEPWNWCNLNSGYMYKYCKNTCDMCKCQHLYDDTPYNGKSLVWWYNETSGYEDCLYFYKPYDIQVGKKNLSQMWQTAFQDHCKEFPGMNNIPNFSDGPQYQYLNLPLIDLLVDLYNGYKLVFGKSVNKQKLMLRYRSGWNQTFWENIIIGIAVNTEWSELRDTTYRLAGKVDFENDYKAYAFYFHRNDPSWSKRDIGERYIARMGEEEFLSNVAGVTLNASNVDITICAFGERSHGNLLRLRRCNSLYLELAQTEERDRVYRACLYKNKTIGWPVESACFKEKCNKNERCISFYGSRNKKCICKEGYWNRSGLCSDIDECTDAATIPTSNSRNRMGSQRCAGDNEICRNTNGSFECDCRKFYKRTGGKCKAELPGSKCTNTYPVSHDRKSPIKKYKIASKRDDSATPKTCQDYCSEDENCRSVKYEINDSMDQIGGHCTLYKISVQTLNDKGGESEIWTEPSYNGKFTSSFSTSITYDRHCECPPGLEPSSYPVVTCKPCSSGFFKPSQGNENCTECKGGEVSKNKTSCVELPSIKCTYPVKHDWMNPSESYYLGNMTDKNSTKETCQAWCDKNVNCKSVLFRIFSYGYRDCYKYNISVQELIDTGRGVDWHPRKTGWITTWITYDKYCISGELSTLNGTVTCLPMGYGDKATCHAFSCSFIELEILGAPIRMCVRPVV